jgi:hypothetical protein
MALHYDLSGIENNQTVCYSEGGAGNDVYMNPVTKAIVLMMMVIEVGEIKTDNVPEVFSRISIFERINGNSVYDVVDGVRKPHYITLEDVKNHIGLKTNAPNSSRNEFLKKCKDWLKRDLEGTFSDTKRKLLASVSA